MRRLVTLLAFLALPLAEIAVFIAVGSLIGVGWTLLLILLSTVFGVATVRQQSLSALQAVRAQARTGTLPEREIVNGAVRVLAGLLLIVPGFITSAIGLLLLVPPVREALWRSLRSRIVVRSAAGRPFADPRGPMRRPGVVDLDAAEFQRQGDGEPGPSDPGSPWREIEIDRQDGRDRRDGDEPRS